MNCGFLDEEIFFKSCVILVDELKCCERLGLCFYNFYFGFMCGKIIVEEFVGRIVKSIN